MEPRQKPGRSKQDYGTPPEFLAAVKALLGVADFDCDLAANHDNHVTETYLSVTGDAFAAPSWKFGVGWNFLNPPFSKIGPWVARVYAEKRRGVQTAVLIPAAVGANWWRDHVHNKAHVLFLNGRIKFVGATDLYPKDCALLLYSYTWQIDYDVWTWKPSRSSQVTGEPLAVSANLADLLRKTDDSRV